MSSDVIPIGWSNPEPTEPLLGTEDWLSEPSVKDDGSLREAGDELDPI